MGPRKRRQVNYADSPAGGKRRKRGGQSLPVSREPSPEKLDSEYNISEGSSDEVIAASLPQSLKTKAGRKFQPRQKKLVFPVQKP